MSTKPVLEYFTAGQTGLALGKHAVIKTSPVGNWRDVGRVLNLNPAVGAFETERAIYINYERVKEMAVQSLRVTVQRRHRQKVGLPA